MECVFILKILNHHSESLILKQRSFICADTQVENIANMSFGSEATYTDFKEF